MSLRVHQAGLLLVASFACVACATSGGPPSAKHALLGARVSVPDQVEASSTREPPSAAPPKRTLILFWSPSCQGCSRWLALLDRLWRRGETDSVRVLGVAVLGSQAAIQQKMAEYAIGFPHVYDPEGEWMDRLQVEFLPRLMVVDGEQRLQYVSPVSADAEVIEDAYWR